MKRKIIFLLVIITAVVAPLLYEGTSVLKLYEVATGAILTPEEIKTQLHPFRIIIVGEHHAVPEHHRMQVQVIDTLHSFSVPVAIGMEMFQRDSQEVLDQWIAGRIEEGEFKKVFMDNWGYSWDAYRPILVYARDNRIPIIGLNVPRAITSQVVREGFDSLTREQRVMLPGVTCDVSPHYKEFIRDAYGTHAHEDMDFVKFCEAQLVWDTAMAVHALDYLAKNPSRTMVILTGSGHARKMGIPAQIAKLSTLTCAVILPESSDMTRETIGNDDADFVAVDLGGFPSGLHCRLLPRVTGKMMTAANFSSTGHF